MARKCCGENCSNITMFGLCNDCRDRSTRSPTYFGQGKEAVEGNREVEKRYPGNKGHWRVVAHVVAGLIVAGFRLFEAILQTVFEILYSLAKNL